MRRKCRKTWKRRDFGLAVAAAAALSPLGGRCPVRPPLCGGYFLFSGMPPRRFLGGLTLWQRPAEQKFMGALARLRQR